MCFSASTQTWIQLRILGSSLAVYRRFLQLADRLSPDSFLGRFRREFTRVTPSSADHSSSSFVDMQSARLRADPHLSGSFRTGGSSTGTISSTSRNVLECCNVAVTVCSSLDICASSSTSALASGAETSSPVVSGVSSLGSLSWTESVDFSWSKNKQTTAQSSLLDVGNFNLQDLTAQSTRALAAVARDGADAMISTASLFERTSQTYKRWTFQVQESWCCWKLLNLSV